jgi:hypothetical protein
MEEAVAANAKWVQDRREAAWASGRQLRDHLLLQYQQKYNLSDTPPPAIIIPDLIRDFITEDLFFDPLPLDRYAEIRLVDGKPAITVNSDIHRMDKVKDPLGVANVAMWHEVMHTGDDLGTLHMPASAPLPGFEEPPTIVCLRAPGKSQDSVVREREFWAEEAGRAAAVSLAALNRTDPFREFLHLARRTTGAVRSGFPLLYQSAAAIGVNISALTTQLKLEGLIAIEGNLVFVQAELLEKFDARG